MRGAEVIPEGMGCNPAAAWSCGVNITENQKPRTRNQEPGTRNQEPGTKNKEHNPNSLIILFLNLPFSNFPSSAPLLPFMDTMITQLLAVNQRRISALCSKLLVKELRLFGSAVSEKFNESTSDLDVAVEFYDPDAPGIADRFMALALGLEGIFQRPVDLVTMQGMKNPIFRARVEQTSQPLYAA